MSPVDKTVTIPQSSWDPVSYKVEMKIFSSSKAVESEMLVNDQDGQIAVAEDQIIVQLKTYNGIDIDQRG